MNTLVFDIETVPDTDLGRRLYGLHDLSDEHVAQIMFTKRRQETGSEFLSHEQHRVVAISVVMRTQGFAEGVEPRRGEHPRKRI